MADYLNIAGRIRTTASDGVAMEAQEVKDLNQNKSQQEINADVQTELGDRYTKEETYSKEQLDDLITTPDVNYVSVVATDATTAVTDILPATGEANTIYRVGNWNGTQYDTTMYALFAWNGSTYVCLAVRSFVGEVYDISVNHPDGQGNPTPYADLTAALGTSGANIPADIRRGGMSVKFVLTSDNKYMQYFLTKDEWSASEGDWEKINLEEEVSQLGQEVSDLDNNKTGTSNLAAKAFDIEDENHNAIVIFEKGNIKTKNFDSSNISRSNLSEELNAALIHPIDTEDKILLDFSIEDENHNAIALFKDGGITTKKFSDATTPKIEESLLTDFDIKDADNNLICVFQSGHIRTKNFSSAEVINILNGISYTSLEDWSKMPGISPSNPLRNIRLDGGMCYIFRQWGFIGDSLASGESVGYKNSQIVASISETDKCIISGIVTNRDGYIITQSINVTQRYPAIKLVFANNEGLSGITLVAFVNNDNYADKVIGTNAVEYTLLDIPSNQSTNIVFSYPSNNEPIIILSTTYSIDKYELSWGQQLCNLINAEGYNFSVGGQFAKQWCLGSNSRTWGGAQTNIKDVYVIGMGANDSSYWLGGNTSVVDYPCVTAYPNQSDYVSTLVLTDSDVMSDIDLTDYSQNANSFAGWYAGIIQRLKSVSIDCHIFCITNPNTGSNQAWNQAIRIIVDKMREKYGNTIWLIDLNTYNPLTPEINQNTQLNGTHLSAFGYMYSAYQISTYIDWIIRSNIDDFKGSAFINLYDENIKVSTNRFENYN